MKQAGWLGFLFFVALVLLGFATLIVKHVRLFGESVKMVVHFEAAEGLREGSDVRVDGVQMGRVVKVELHPERGVRVHLDLEKKIVLYQDSEILTESASVLGGNIVSIKRGSRPPEKDLTQEFAGKGRPGLQEVGELAADNRENLKQLITNLKDMTQALRDGQGTIGKLLKTDELHKETVETVKAAREAINEAKTEIRKVGDKITEKLDKAEGPAGALLNDKKMTDKLDRIVTNVEETSKNLKEITEAIRKGDGALGKMVGDKEMGEKLKTTIDNVEKTSESIKNVSSRLEIGEGSLGKLLQDEELYEQAQRTLEDVDTFFGRAARSVVEIYAEYHDNFDTKMNVSKLGLRLSPGIDKYFQVGASFLSCSKEGKIVRYENQADGEDQSFIKGDVILAYRIPWFLDYRLTVRGGLMEGKPGGGVDFLMYDWGLFSYPVQFSFEIRDAYNSVKNEDIDEQISGPLMRGYVKAPLWIRKGAWYETLLSTARIYAGVNRLGKDPEFSAGISVEWADDDIKTLVGFITLSR